MIFWLGVVLSCSVEEACDDVGEVASDLAGPGAKDCSAEDLDAAWACAAEALDAGRAFFLTWDEQGIDSVLHEALAWDGERAVLLHQDTYGAGPWGIDGWVCVEPSVSGSAVDCAAREPEDNHYQVCGEICDPDVCQPQPLPFPTDD